MRENWYEIRARSGGTTAEIWLYDEIGGWGVSAKDFIAELNRLQSQTIDLHINSPGGSVFDGAAVYNALVNHPAQIVTYIDGLAGSIASVVALAGDIVAMAENAFYMIHNPWAAAVGDASNLRKTADVLDKVRDTILGAYARKTGKGPEELQALMDAETWFTAAEAKASGFVDEVTVRLDLAATFDLAKYGYLRVPTALTARTRAGAAPEKVLDAVRANSSGRSHALSLVSAGRVNRDASWSFSAEDGNEILGDPPNWERYAQWFLGEDPTESEETKARYKYPYGKNGQVYRSGVIAAKQRASQQGATSIVEAASTILDRIDASEENARAQTPTATCTGAPAGEHCGMCNGAMDDGSTCSGAPADGQCCPGCDCVECEQAEEEGEMETNSPAAATAAAHAAPKASTSEGTEMGEIVTQPQAGANPSTDILAIVQLCEMSHCGHKAAEWIAAKKTPFEVGQLILDGQASGALPQPSAEQGLGVPAKDLRRYSVVKAIRQQLLTREHKGSLDGLELEIHQEIAAHLPSGYAPQGGVYVPMQIMAAGLDTQTATSGAEYVFTQPGEFIELLRNKAVAVRLGARVLTGLVGPVGFPTQTGAVTAYWMAENSGTDVTESTIATSLKTLTPKTVQSLTKYSRQLLFQAPSSNISLEAMVRADITAVHALAIDKAVIHGSGSSNEPTGIYYGTGVNAYAMGGVPTYAKLVEAETAVAQANADLGALAWVTNPGTAGLMMRTAELGSTFPKWVWEGSFQEGRMANYPAVATNQASAVMNGSAATGGTSQCMVFGNWNDIIIGMWGAMELVVDPYTLAGQAMFRLISFQMMDLILRHGASFTKVTGATLS